MYIADLHIHSKYSRATSPEGDVIHLDLWARKKGIDLVGTGDFTHPVWREELKKSFIPAEEGFYTLKDELRLPSDTAETKSVPRFIVTGEISSIYKKNGKTRKIHNLILLPGLDEADAIAKKLEAIGNIHSDGRPILGLDSRDLLEIVLDTCPNAMFIPAHIWTPHFALFGAFSGFDTIEECFEDLTGEIHAVETGLSSDPPMNWRVSALDRFTLVSNSDAHSPSKLGREANLLNTGLSYTELKHAIETGEGFGGTIEFFPEEGKYHLDGHRNCLSSLSPEETEKLNGKCPVCGKKITIGVLHRVLELADRPEGYKPPHAKPFESLIPLPEVIADSTGNSVVGKKTEALYNHMLKELGPEFVILRDISIEEISRVAGSCVAEGIRRLRERKVQRIAGYDGKYGEIRLFDAAERDMFSGQTLLFGMSETTTKNHTPTKSDKCKSEPLQVPQKKLPEKVNKDFVKDNLNDEQCDAVTAQNSVVAVIAGPGTGKTKTLVARIAYLIENCGIDPSEITAVTFTNKAAEEMKKRLVTRLGGERAIRGLTVGTFHAVCRHILDGRPIISENEAIFLLQDILDNLKIKKSARNILHAISDVKNGKAFQEAKLDQIIFETYCARLKKMGFRDLDDLLLDALTCENKNPRMFNYLLIDEFQDINIVQRNLVRHWNTAGKSLFVIGDPDQSIYGFRGASAACFSDLLKDFPTTKVITLKKNYRSTPEIISCALPVISHNSGTKRELEATCSSGVPVRILTAESTLSEGIWIAKEIAKMTGGLGMLDAQKYAPEQQKIRSFSEIAVLCRTHHQLEKIEYCLQHDSIPYIVSGRGDELNDPSVIGALAFFRFLLNPCDIVALSVSLRLVINLSGKQIEQIISASQIAAGCNVFSTSSGVNDIENKTDSEEQYLTLGEAGCPKEFIEDIEKYLPLVRTEQPHKLLEQWSAEREKNDAMEHLLDISLFHKTMQEFLDILTFGEEADLHRASGKNYVSGAVQLMTLHGAKGLEFPVVFLAGISDKLLPLERKDTQVNIEEERRLFFVGMTRAKEELILTSAAPVSDFLGELPDFVHRYDANPKRHKQEPQQLKLF